MFIRIEYILLAAAEICVDLNREQRILGYVSVSRVSVERKQEQPDHTHDDT